MLTHCPQTRGTTSTAAVYSPSQTPCLGPLERAPRGPLWLRTHAQTPGWCGLLTVAPCYCACLPPRCGPRRRSLPPQTHHPLHLQGPPTGENGLGTRVGTRFWSPSPSPPLAGFQDIRHGGHTTHTYPRMHPVSQPGLGAPADQLAADPTFMCPAGQAPVTGHRSSGLRYRKGQPSGTTSSHRVPVPPPACSAAAAATCRVP